MVKSSKQQEIVQKTASIKIEVQDLLIHCNAYESILPAENTQAREIISVLKGKISNLYDQTDDLLDFMDTPGKSSPLTKRETQILQMVSTGMYNKEIAYQLKISDKTVQFHLKSVFTKLSVNSRTEASTKAAQEGWITI